VLLDINDSVYINIIEPIILEKTKEYYEQDYIKNIQIKNCQEYSIYVKKRIKDEEFRVNELNLNKRE
jgi:hypothetical protein